MADIIDLNERRRLKEEDVKREQQVIVLKKKSDYIVNEFKMIIDQQTKKPIEPTNELSKTRIQASLDRINQLIKELKGDK